MVGGGETEHSTEQPLARQQLLLWRTPCACVRGRNIAWSDKGEKPSWKIHSWVFCTAVAIRSDSEGITNLGRLFFDFWPSYGWVRRSHGCSLANLQPSSLLFQKSFSWPDGEVECTGPYLNATTWGSRPGLGPTITLGDSKNHPSCG